MYFCKGYDYGEKVDLSKGDWNPKRKMWVTKGYDYGEKVDLSKGDWNPKRKMWVTTHFSEIIKQP